ncbi:branched-chain amino acid transporter permease [Actinomadura sp. 21ATH]|uniref:branched-chain amino acid transporter permease n=1 Tax=Actinomadura sp. 21ATH TaxID=1735444 RepID=UPI0035C21DC7
MTALFTVLGWTPSATCAANDPPRRWPSSAAWPPAEVMIILNVYCLREVPLDQPRALAPLTALAVTMALHLWRRNALLSILGGTHRSRHPGQHGLHSLTDRRRPDQFSRSRCRG